MREAEISREQTRGLGIRARFFLLILLAVVPFAVLEVVRLPERRALNERLAMRESERIAAVLGSRAEVELGHVRSAVSALSQVLVADRSQMTANDARLRQVVASLPSKLTVTMAVQTIDDQNAGQSFEQKEGRDRLRARGRKYWTDALADTGLVVSEAVVSRRDSVWTVFFAQAIHDRRGAVAGVLIATLRLNEVQQFVLDRVLPAGATATIVDQTGRILARSPNHDRWVGQRVFNADSQAIARRGLRTAITRGIDSTLVMLANQPIQSSPWMLYVGIPLDIAYADVRRQLNRDIAYGVATTLVALLLAWLVGGRLSKPVRLLTSDAQALERGDLSRRSAVTTRGEIGQLAASFNRMAGALEHRDAAMRESESRYRTLFQHSPFPIWMLDGNTLAFLEVNEAALATYGWSRDEFLRMNALDLTVPEEREDAALALRAERSARAADAIWHHRTRDGRLLEVEVSSTQFDLHGRHATLAVMNDVTQRRLASHELATSQEQLRQVQKMDAVGRLAGGIAHDFNNLLTVIASASELVRASLPPDRPEIADVDEIRAAAERAAGLTRQLLAFSRQQALETYVLDLGRTVQNLEGMLRRLIGEHITVAVDVCAEPTPMLGDAGRLEQVIVNLCINARDAMPRGGTLRLGVSSVDADVECAARRVALQPGRYVRLTVSDTGIGMDEQTKSQIFEPFFTTKDVGRGTGLGLSTVYGIVRQSNGVIWVESAPDAGATFEVYLPRVDAAPGASAETRPAPTARGGESLLLVEDEEVVRAITARILSSRGFTVTTATNGEEALALASDPARHFDVILSDMVMPVMSGPDFIAQLRIRGHQTPVVFMSGYTDHEVLRENRPQPGDGFVQKPFTTDVLVRRVRAALGYQD